jgi:hypothetical protein
VIDAYAGEIDAMTTGWGDLTNDEQTALKRMNRGPYPALSKSLAERLVSLGLAAERPNGIGISRAGRELVINALLAARPD